MRFSDAGTRPTGADKTSAYARRKRDPVFAADWSAAAAGARARLAGGEQPVLGPDEYVRASRAWRPCVMRTGAGERPRYGWRKTEPTIEEERAEVL